MEITPKYTEIVDINWFRSNFIEFKKVIDIGADKPVFVLRALVVQYTYNAVMPKIRSETTVKPLTFTEALLFTLFVSFLFP